TRLCQLASALVDFFDRGGHWTDLAITQTDALAAARRLAHPPRQAAAHRTLAFAYGRLARFDDADTHLRQALDLYGGLHDRIGQARVWLDLALVVAHQGHYVAALGHGERAFELFRAAGSRYGEAAALNAVGRYHAQLRDEQAALACCQQALAM